MGLFYSCQVSTGGRLSVRGWCGGEQIRRGRGTQRTKGRISETVTERMRTFEKGSIDVRSKEMDDTRVECVVT